MEIVKFPVSDKTVSQDLARSERIPHLWPSLNIPSIFRQGGPSTLPLIELIFAVGFAALGRWVYLNPDRVLGSFLVPTPYSNFLLRFMRSVGTLWMFVGVYVMIAFLGQLFRPYIPGIILIVIYLVLSVMATRLLINRFSRQTRAVRIGMNGPV
jgi:hypothetical protein